MYDFNGDFATFFTGKNDIRMSGLYDTFHGSPFLPQWNGEHCSKIQGASDGTKFKSFMQENDTLLFFRKSMCRPQRLVSILIKCLFKNNLTFHFFHFFPSTTYLTNLHVHLSMTSQKII